jgi:hypothetical protein
MNRKANQVLLLMGAALLCVVAGVALVWAEDAAEERLPAGTCTARPEGEGWIDLFSAENAGQWKNVTDKKGGIFEIKDGVFIVPGQKPTRYIAWMGRDFGDFELHIEYKVAEGANSGVFFRTDPEDPVQGGMEVQVYDSFGDAPGKSGCGALYDIATPMFNMSLPAGEWNSFDITCKGAKVDVFHNGWKVLDLDLSKMTMPIGKFDTPLAELPEKGHVILQNHGDDVWFRNLVVKPL